MRAGLLVVGGPSDRLKAAFNAVKLLHRAFDAHPRTQAGGSLRNCILSAQIAASALCEMGLQAQAIPVAMICVTPAPGQPDKVVVRRIGSIDGTQMVIHATTGSPLKGWNGHMVVHVEDYILDPTFCQVEEAGDVQETWNLPRMIALPYQRQPALRSMTSLARYRGMIAGSPFDIAWLDTPENAAYKKESKLAEQVEIIRRDVAITLANSGEIVR